MVATIDRIQKHAKEIADGKHERVKPGQPAQFTEACTRGDCIVQGDLYLVVVESVPAGFVKIKAKQIDRQLVPGNTQGAKHVLDSLDGVTLYRPENWNAESLVGPVFVTTKARTVEHPVHGHVHIPAGFTIACHYQREFDQEQKRERRAAD